MAGVLTDHLFAGFPLRSLHLRESVNAFVYSSVGHKLSVMLTTVSPAYYSPELSSDVGQTSVISICVHLP